MLIYVCSLKFVIECHLFKYCIFVHIYEHGGINMSDNKKRLYNKDKHRNRFLKLRYKDGATIKDLPIRTGREISAITGISTGKISELESESLRDYNPSTKEAGDIPNCTAKVLKAYHDEFNCSYEYLMGETNNRKTEYYALGKDPFLSGLDDSFWDNLKKLLSDDSSRAANVYMLNLLLNNPTELEALFDTIFHKLYEINCIKSYKLPKAIEASQIGAVEYTLNVSINRYLEDVLLPNMQPAFKEHQEQLPAINNAVENVFADMSKSDIFK